MLLAAIKHAGAVDSYTKAYFETLETEFLSSKKREMLRTISKFLYLFDRGT